MRSYRNILLWALLATTTCGCASFWHDLKPHRLRRINRGPAPSLDPEFSRASTSSAIQFVRRDKSGKPAVLTANSAEITLARGQNAE